MRKSVGVTLAISLAFASGASADPWKDWYRLVAGRCPSHHVEWICGDCQLFIVEAFAATLTAPQQRRVSEIADIRRACAEEVAGFSCEMGRSMRAYEKLGLMNRFVKFGCRTVKCEEGALCSRFPREPLGR